MKATKSKLNDHEVYEFDRECERKENLLTLFEIAEAKERERKKAQHSRKARTKYARIVRDMVSVTKVNESSLELVRETGEPIAPLLVSPEIARLVRPHDQFLLSAGHENGAWHVIFVEMILTPPTSEDLEMFVDGCPLCEELKADMEREKLH